jgi:DnaJ-class molecular chaperone
MRDPYEILGVSRTATADEIKSAYRKLAKKYHPDLGGDPEKFKEINQANDILSDPDKKAHYDSGGFNSFHPGANAYRNGTHFHFEDIFSNEDFMNIFAQAAGFPGARRKPKNSNIRIRMSITLESVLQEQSKTIDIGSGNTNKQVEIKIPAGIHDGAVITYRGMGQNIYPDQPAGDLMVEITVLPHERFVRANEDLHSNITIDCFKATLGTSIEFVTIRGKRIKVNIPAGSQNGAVLRLPSEGLPSMNRNKFIGSQYLKINVSVPTNLTNEQIELVKQIVTIQNGLNN